MEFININTLENKFEKNKPRFLTKEEIEIIVDQVPNTYGADSAENDNIRESIKNYFRDIIKQKKITPEAINSISNQIVKHHNQSRIAAGTTVGSSSSEALSAAPFQAQMNAFHSAGQSRSGAGGINEFEELFYAKKNRKIEICTLQYANKTLSFEEVLDTKKDIEGCMFTQFVQDYLYIKESDKYVKKYDIEMYDSLAKKWWHNDYYITKVLKSKIPNPHDYVLRIYLNIKEMYKYKVSIQDLVDAFQREHDTPISLIYGSIQDAFIDVYACADFVANKKDVMVLEAVKCNNQVNDMATSSFYQTIIMPGLSTLRIKGISGITNLTPIKIPVVSVILDDDTIAYILYTTINKNIKTLFNLLSVNVIDEQQDYILLTMPKYENISYFFTGKFVLSKGDFSMLNPLQYIDLMIKIDKQNNPKNKQTNLIKTFSLIKELTIERVHIVNLSHKKMKKNGIELSMIKNLFKVANILIINQNLENYNPVLLVKIEQNDSLIDYQLTPRNLINKLIKNDEKKNERTDILKYSELVYAEVLGSNLKGLLSLSFLDKTRLKSNNMHVVASVYGNRAARKLFIDEVFESMSVFGVTPAHLLLVADVFFSRGVPTGAMFNSVNKQLGPVDKATVSKAVEIFKASSLHGVNHDISGVSTHIAFGVAPKIGTGYFDIAYHGKEKVSINNEMYTSFKNERAYVDRLASEVVALESDDPNKDLQQQYEKEEIKTISRAPIPRGKKVNLSFQEPVIRNIATVPVSKYSKAKVEKKEEPFEAKVPVSKYAKKKVVEEDEEDEKPKVPVSKYIKKKVVEEDEEDEEPEIKIPVSKYTKKVQKKEAPKVPVSKYTKKVIKKDEEKEEEEEEEKEENPKLPVSKYSKTLKSDISVKYKSRK
jgi:hypothetical protein